MGKVYGALLILALFMPWAFFKTSPAFDEDPSKVAIFNKMIVGFIVMLSIAWLGGCYLFLSTYMLMQHFAILGTLGIVGLEVLFFTLFGLLRNFWIFKTSNIIMPR